MLAIFYGSDRISLSKKASEYISKQGVDEVVAFDEMNVSASELLSFAEQSTLFGGKRALKCDGVFDNEGILEQVLKHKKSFAESTNVFVFLEGAIKISNIRDFEKVGAICQEFKLSEKKKETFNIFSLADALSRRDRKSLWVLYQKALRAGKAPEEISGTLFWQLKTLSILESGGGNSLSPFVVSKNKSALKNFKEGELQSLTEKLIDNYHSARSGRGDMETAIERFLISI